MKKAPAIKSEANIGSLVISALFVIAGIVTLYDTTGYSDIDSKVFPRTVAIVLIICATIAFITNFLKPTDTGGFGSGIWWRRITLVVTMLLACFAMPYVGFLPAGAIAFAGGLVAAMHDQWSMKTFLLYGGSGAVVMIAFFALFKYALLVPLP
ncbi:MAG: tripartite tricarboxylate transporter TctB family protein [Stappiaceae bacterium]